VTLFVVDYSSTLIIITIIIIIIIIIVIIIITIMIIIITIIIIIIIIIVIIIITIIIIIIIIIIIYIVERTCADISKARALLGYNPQVTFEEGISRTAEWYRQAYAEGLFDETPEVFFPVTKDPIKRGVSDLELSSFVEKAVTQMTERSFR
jgi:hypothetical protein